MNPIQRQDLQYATCLVIKMDLTPGGCLKMNVCVGGGGPSRQASWHGDPHFIILQSVARTRQVVKIDLGPAMAPRSTRGASVRARSRQLWPGGQSKEINTEIVYEDKG